MEQIETKQIISVVLSERTSDQARGCLKILMDIFSAIPEKQSDAKLVQKLIDKLDHKQDQDGKATGLWL